MQIANVGALAASAVTPKTPETAEGSGPDHDGDSDDSGGAVKSARAPGVGQTADVSA